MVKVEREYVDHLVALAFRSHRDTHDFDGFVNEAFLLIQTAVHTDDGGVAGVWYSDEEIEERLENAYVNGQLTSLREIFWEYAELENSYVEDAA